MMTMDEMVHGVVHGAGTAHADKHDDRRPDQIGSDLRLVPDFRSPIDSPARVARGRAVARAACRCRGHAGPLFAHGLLAALYICLPYYQLITVR